MNKLKYKLKLLSDKGFFSIYLSSILSKVITLLGGVILVRLLSKSNYGIYSLVINCISILSLCGDFGSSWAILQYSIENRNNKEKQASFINFGIKLGIMSGIITALLLLFSQVYYPYKNDKVALYSTLMFLVPILTIFVNYFSVFLRIEQNNKKYALFQFLITLIHYTITILGTLIFGLKGAIFSQYIYNILLIFLGIIFTKEFIKLRKVKGKLNTKEKKNYISFSFSSQINHTISNLLYTLDIFVIGFLNLPIIELTYYKVATIIPNALSFLPACLMDFLVPYFIKKNKNNGWLKENIKKVIFYGFIAYGLLSILLIFSSKIIIYILYGSSYLESSKIFKLLIIGFFVNATFKIPISHILYIKHKVNLNLIVSVLGLCLNFIFNILFVKFFGSIGAAYSTIFVTIIMSVISLIFLIKVLNTKERDNII